jgi:methyl-accepting chemotaxis protein
VGVDGIKEIQTALNNFESKKIEEARESMRDLGTASEKVGKAIDEADQEMEEFGSTVDETNRRARDIDNLANSIKDFFSITNTV